MTIFRFNDYRDAIAHLISSSKKNDTKLSYSEMADFIRVQKGYISRVLKKEAHLSTDQLYLTSEYLKLSDEQLDFLLLLLEYNRSALAQRKKILRQRVHDIQSQHRDTRNHLKADMLNPEDVSHYGRYYLDPYTPLVHTFLSIPYYAKQTSALAVKLGLSEKRLNQIIQVLIELKIIALDKSKSAFKIIRDHMQLVADSPLNLPYQIFQRTNAIHKIQTQSLEDRFIFSVTFSADEKSKTEIHEAFLKFLSEAEKIVKSSEASEVYQINFDLFGWK